jgi:glycosyltransferase involved in cell wall biosynthesis
VSARGSLAPASEAAISDTPRRIVMALENNPYPQDVRVRNEARELTAAGHQVTVLAPRDSSQPKVETIDGVRVVRYWLPERAGVLGILAEYAIAVVQLSARLLGELLRGAQVVHLHNPPDLFFPIAALARTMGRTVVFDHHDLAPELFEQKFGGGPPTAILRWCERMTIRCADVVLAANESHRRIAIERDRADPARVVVVRNAPRRHTVAGQASTRKGELEHPRLCYVGSLASQDGVAMLPEIVQRLCQCGLDPALAIAGDGPELETIRRLAEAHGVAARIELMGHVAHEQIPAIIREADVCLDVAPCTPLNHCSTMIKIGEYMAAGRPIVSFPLEETRYTAGDCALYAHGEDAESFVAAIARLCKDAALRAELAASALERARTMTWEHSADRLHHAYSLTGARRARDLAMVSG